MSGIALSDAKMIKATSNEINIMHTKCMGPDDMISSLSGGNQQKVIFGKWLERSPQVFMMDEPTRGIDVGAKYEIYLLMKKAVENGSAIILISSELPEVLNMSNRVLTIANGRITGEFDPEKSRAQEIMNMAIG